MNFLSHFYFERFAVQSERVVGSLLPDFLKNVDKSFNFQPLYYHDELLSYPGAEAILAGWKRHVEVDRIFHSSNYFIEHCHKFRRKIIKPLEKTDIRTTFFAHVAIELILDHLLIVEKQVNVFRLYEHLENANEKTLKYFLNTIGLEDTDSFFNFYERFIQLKYIHEYQNFESLVTAMINICRRLWKFEITSEQKGELAFVFREYTREEMWNYKDIFVEIQDRLT